MPATKNGKPPVSREDELLKMHRELVAEYPVKTGAAKAQVSRRINQAQVEMDLLDVEYDFWVKPETAVTRTWIHSPEELVERIQKLRHNLTRTDRSEPYLAQADRELTNALDQAEKRGIEVPES